jgi:hypothetical protein
MEKKFPIFFRKMFRFFLEFFFPKNKYLGSFDLAFLSLRSYFKVKSENKSFQKKEIKLFGNCYFFNFKVIFKLKVFW